jgi:hypothetical protein
MDGRSIMLAACHEGYEWNLRAVYHADGSGVTQALKRLEARAARNRSLAKKLEQLTKLSRVTG